MTSPVLKNINQSQKDFYNLIKTFEKDFDKDILDVSIVAKFIDQVKCFWLERVEIIKYELELMTSKNMCFLLSGAIYLDVSENSHYYFKTFGSYHLLNDPFLRMEGFFRLDESKIDKKETSSYFKNVYKDTLSILTNYTYSFYILPIRELAVSDERKHLEFLNDIYIKYISNIFHEEFETEIEFSDKFKSYEEIEKKIDSKFKKHLIFNDITDSNLPIRAKIENYMDSQMNLAKLTKGKSESEIFLLILKSCLIQVIDILLICLELNLNPYIRFETTFQYLILIMYGFITDMTLKEMIEKTIVFYIFIKTIDVNEFQNIEFTDYYCRIKDQNIMLDILDKMHENKIDIFEGGIKEVQKIVLDRFASILV